MHRRKILINGGGIAGLTAALSLAKAGNRVEIFEQAPFLEEVGAGLQISPNAFHVLNGLGLKQELLDVSDAPASILMMDAKKGEILATLPLGYDVEDKYGAPYLVLHRGSLQRILLNACNQHTDISITYQSEVIDAALHQNGVTALVRTGEEVKEHRADVLVGADGVRSRVRRDITELPDAQYSGKVAWRTLIPASQLSAYTSLTSTVAWLGPKAHAITYPVENGKMLNVIAVTQESNPDTSGEISNDALREKISYWHEVFTKLFEADAKWLGWPLYETPKLKTMAYKNVALIGDAAHAMLPFAAQGAAQAIEDAAVLAQELKAQENIELALLSFEKKRLGRVRRIMQTARNNGRIYHMTGLPAMLRNMALASIPGHKLLQKQDWVYRWKP